ncbi:MAG TPA: hypothetical protein VIH59_07420 [Candidatus Tectomicrobia bacterium]
MKSGLRFLTAPGIFRPWHHFPPVMAVQQAIDGAGGYTVPYGIFKRFFDRTCNGKMPRLTCCEKRSQQGTLCINSKLGVLPSAFPSGLQGVRPIAIIGFNELPDRKHGQAEPARDLLGRSRSNQGMTNDQPPSDAPKIMEVLEPCINLLWVGEAPELRQFHKQVVFAIDGEQQQALIRQMERHTHDQAYFLFLYNPIGLYAVTKP